jgi:DNA polymerase-3 subunit delta'
MENVTILPWLNAVYQQLAQTELRGHAFLLLGATGLGQPELINALLRHHLRTQHIEDHPDIFRIARLEGKRDIGVDQVRQMTNWVQHSAHGQLGRWVVIEDLELMNTAAANSVLKTLEEPPTGVRFLLTAQRAGKLLPTILSRCQQWTITPPTLTTATQWLQAQQTVSDEECAFALTLHHYAPSAARDWLSGQGLPAWRVWRGLWQKTLELKQITADFIQWAVEDPERFFTLLSAQCYVNLQDHQDHYLPIIRICWNAQRLLRQNASKELLIDQVLQAVSQTLRHQEPDIRLNHRRGLLA